MSLYDSSRDTRSDSSNSDCLQHVHPQMFQMSPRQLCLRHCGFVSAAEAEVSCHRCCWARSPGTRCQHWVLEVECPLACVPVDSVATLLLLQCVPGWVS